MTTMMSEETTVKNGDIKELKTVFRSVGFQDSVFL
jgi:hypothetical protein